MNQNENTKTPATSLEIKIIMNEGIVEAVLKNQDIPVNVELIRIDPDYPDCKELEAYAEFLRKDRRQMVCDFTTARFDEDGENEGMNTRISYTYRDGGNNKMHNCCIVAGRITKEMEERIRECLFDGDQFLPDQVGFPGKNFVTEGFDYIPELDTPWYELNEDAFEATCEAPTVNLTAQDVESAFLACKDKWQPW